MVVLPTNPHLPASFAVLEWAEKGGRAAVDWHSLANCCYLLKGGRGFLNDLLDLVEVAHVGSRDAKIAMGLPLKDLEDAFQAASALAWKADFIITRNHPDYRHSPVPAVSPAAFIKRVSDSGQ